MVTDITFGGLFRKCVIFAVSILLLWLLIPFSSYFETHGITIHNTIGTTLLVLLAAGAAITLWFLVELFLTPARMDAEAHESISVLSAELSSRSSRLEVSLENGGKLTNINTGETHETYGGERHTFYIESHFAVSLLCKNTGMSVAKVCQVRLTRIWNLSGDEAIEVPLLEGIPLGWSRYTDPLELSCDILPGETKRIYVASVRANGRISLWMPLDRQPLEYHSVFDVPGSYRLEMALCHDAISTQIIHLDAESSISPMDLQNPNAPRASLKLSQPVAVR